MSQNVSSTKEACQQAKRAARKASPWIERLARFGYLAYGVVYVLVGFLAIQAAIGGGEAASQEGALSTVLRAPLGRGLLGLIVAGLLGYAMWRLIQGIRDPENEGKGAKGLVKRVDHVVNGLFHGALALSAGQLALGGEDSGGSGGSPDDLTAQLMGQPFGRWLILAVGVIIAGAGLYQFRKAYKADFREEIKVGEMSPSKKRWTTRVGRVGYISRGIVFGLIGTFLALAALQTDPQQARGLGGVLQTLAQQPFGPHILGAVAAGFIAYGVFMFVMARYRRIRPA